MESPIATIKSAFNPTTILRWAAVGFVVWFVADFFDFTDWILHPYKSWKNRNTGAA